MTYISFMRKSLAWEGAMFQHAQQHILSHMRYDTDDAVNSPILYCTGQMFTSIQ